MLDESHLPKKDEFADKWCPGWMPGEARVEAGIISSCIMTDRDATTGEWPSDDEEGRWRQAILALLNHVYKNVTELELEASCRSSGGEYRMWFAGLARKYGVKGCNKFLQP